jgi:hypothetical protein
MAKHHIPEEMNLQREPLPMLALGSGEGEILKSK